MTSHFKYKLKSILPLLILGVVGTISVSILTSKFGSGITPDSSYYISVARNFVNTGGFSGYDGYYFILQPPLYPLLLGIIKIILKIDPLFSAGYLNALLFGLIVFYSGLLLLKLLKSYTTVLLGTTSVLVSFTIVQVSLWMMSEPLFIFLLLVSFYYLDNYQTRGDYLSLIIFSVFTALVCLTRYIGIILIFTGLTAILLQLKEHLLKRILCAFIFLFISSVPIGIWLIRNFLVSGTFVGQRAESSYVLSQNMVFLFNTVLQWSISFIFIKQKIYLIILIILGTSITAAVLKIKWSNNKIDFKESFNRKYLSFKGKLYQSPSHTEHRDGILNLQRIIPIIIFTLLYIIFIVISSTTTAYDTINNRLLSPVFIFIIVIILFFCEKIIDKLSKYIHYKILFNFFITLILVWLIYASEQTMYIFDDYIAQSGFGFNNKLWKENSTIQYLSNHKELVTKYTLYSNAPDAVYILTNMKTKWSPAKTQYNSPGLLNYNFDAKELRQDNPGALLIWFNNIDRKFLFTIDELQTKIRTAKIAQFGDGGIYTIENK